MDFNGLGFRFIGVAAAAFLMAACATTDDGDSASAGATSPTQEETTPTPPPAPAADVETEVIDTGPPPGTLEDLLRTAGSDRVFFEFDKSDLKADARQTLQRQADWLRANPGVTVTVEGHCDERGTREYNIALGDRRATAVRNYLVALGINASRISTISYGEERPAVAGSHERAWAQNRRGVTVIDALN